MEVLVNRLIWYCWIFQRPLIKLITPNSFGNFISVESEDMHLFGSGPSWVTGNFISVESEDMHLFGSGPSWVTGLSPWFWMVRSQTRFQPHQGSLRADRLCAGPDSAPHLY